MGTEECSQVLAETWKVPYPVLKSRTRVEPMQAAFIDGLLSQCFNLMTESWLLSRIRLDAVCQQDNNAFTISLIIMCQCELGGGVMNPNDVNM